MTAYVTFASVDGIGPVSGYVPNAPAGNVKSNGMQQLAAEDGELKRRKTPGAGGAHAEVLLLGLEHGVLHQPVRLQRDRERFVQGQHGRVCVLRGCRPLLCQRHRRDRDEE